MEEEIIFKKDLFIHPNSIHNIIVSYVNKQGIRTTGVWNMAAV